MFRNPTIKSKFWINGSALAMFALVPLVCPAAPSGGSDAKTDAPKRLNISAGVAQGMLKQKVAPVYPGIARAARVSGTVVLTATIAKDGKIQGLKVVSGPAMLQQAAFNAVSQWRYTPYLVNNEATEVDTTVTVVFSLGG